MQLMSLRFAGGWIETIDDDASVAEDLSLPSRERELKPVLRRVWYIVAW